MNEIAEFQLAVGRLAHNAAILESATAILLWGLVGVDQEVGRRVLPNSIDRMLPIVTKELPFRVADPELRHEVSTWVAKVRTVWRERSRVIHSVWVPDGEPGTF